MPHVATSEKDIGSAVDYVPPGAGLAELRSAAAECKACNLWMKGTQTVFGEGTRNAEVVLVGEQPGDVEDVEGKPFVGPAGKLLDKALERAGIDRSRAYVTNAVKHFNWDETRGKRRIHKKPNARQVAACRPWLESEVTVLRPSAIVALGATAAQSLLGRDFKLTKHRGELVESDLARYVIATVHPSSILRAPSDDDRRIAMEAFVDDLRRVAAVLKPAVAEHASGRPDQDQGVLTALHARARLAAATRPTRSRR
jgi:uracil-DNA glycosylase family protein